MANTPEDPKDETEATDAATEAEETSEGEGQSTENEEESGDDTTAESDAEETAETTEDGEEATPDEAEDAVDEGTDVPEEAGENPDHEETKTDEPDGPSTAEQLEAALATTSLISSGTATAAEPVAAEPEAHDEEDEEHEEEHTGSLAGRALTWLVLLLAGGGLALWGAPKVAPSLPSGMAPVKAWLTPGATGAEAEIAALRAEMEDRLAALQEAEPEGGPAPEDLAAITGQATELQENLASIQESVNTLIEGNAAVRDRIGALEGADIGERLSQLETRLSGLGTQVETLTGLTADEGALAEGALEELSRFTAALDGLRTEIDDLAAKDGALALQLEEVEASTDRKIEEAAAAYARDVEAAEADAQAAATAAEEAERLATIRASVASIEGAITTGSPYRAALDALSAATETEIPELLAANADSGVATLAQLRAEFGTAAHAAIRADIQATADTGVAGRIGAFFEQQVATRSLTPQEGDSTDAVLSRAEAALRSDDLSTAIAELDTLQGAAADAVTGWKDAALARLSASEALAAFRDAALATN